jgi:hypothetical protein
LSAHFNSLARSPTDKLFALRPSWGGCTASDFGFTSLNTDNWHKARYSFPEVVCLWMESCRDGKAQNKMQRNDF